MVRRRPTPLIARCPHALLAAALVQPHLRHPLRVWLVLRAVESEGPGHIRREAAVAALRAAGLSRGAAYAWIGCLERSVFASARRTKYGDAVVMLSSYAELGETFGVDPNGRFLRFPAGPLLARRYLRTLTLACAAVHDGRPIARATKVGLCGPSPSTQRRAERDHGAQVISNYRRYRPSPTETRAAWAHPAIDEPGVFAGRDAVFEQLPNTTVTPPALVEILRRRHLTASKGAGRTTAGVPKRYLETLPKPGRLHHVLWEPGRATSKCAGGPVVLVRRGGGRIRGGAMAFWDALDSVL